MKNKITSRNPVRAFTVFSTKGKAPTLEDFVAASTEKRAYFIADGFGGAGPGAEAARLASRAVSEFLEKEAGDQEATLPFVLRKYFSLTGNVIFNALVHANKTLIRNNREKSIYERGGTSVLASHFDGDLLALGNVGSCSAWLIREGQPQLLCAPRSYGRFCDPHGEEPSHEGSVPLAALGLFDDLEPEIQEFRVRPGDWVLLHSYGLPRSWVSRIGNLQAREWSPGEAAREVKELLDHARFELNTSLCLMIL